MLSGRGGVRVRYITARTKPWLACCSGIVFFYCVFMCSIFIPRKAVGMRQHVQFRMRITTVLQGEVRKETRLSQKGRRRCACGWGGNGRVTPLRRVAIRLPGETYHPRGEIFSSQSGLRVQCLAGVTVLFPSSASSLVATAGGVCDFLLSFFFLCALRGWSDGRCGGPCRGGALLW